MVETGKVKAIKIKLADPLNFVVEKIQKGIARADIEVSLTQNEVK